MLTSVCRIKGQTDKWTDSHTDFGVNSASLRAVTGPWCVLKDSLQLSSAIVLRPGTHIIILKDETNDDVGNNDDDDVDEWLVQIHLIVNGRLLTEYIL